MSGARRRSGFPALLWPGTIWFFFFLVIPLGIVVAFSVLKKGPYGTILFELDPSNYLRTLEPLYFKILLRSLALAAFTTVSCLILGYPIAYYMARTGERWRRALLALVVIPFWTNFVIRVYALKMVIGETGLLNRVLLELHWISSPLVLVNNTAGVGIGMIYNYLPFMILPVFVALEKLDFTLLDAAYDLGANRAQMAARVLLPLSLPGIATGSMFVFIPAFGEFVIPDLLGGSQEMYIGNLITETFLKSRNWPFGSALSSFLVLFAMISFVTVLARSKRAEARMQTEGQFVQQSSPSVGDLHVA